MDYISCVKNRVDNTRTLNELPRSAVACRTVRDRRNGCVAFALHVPEGRLRTS